jgi:hypothetical protein
MSQPDSLSKTVLTQATKHISTSLVNAYRRSAQPYLAVELDELIHLAEELRVLHVRHCGEDALRGLVGLNDHVLVELRGGRGDTAATAAE